MVLSEPVCDKKDQQTLIQKFLNNNESTAFIQIPESLTKLLFEQFGYHTTQFGIESVIDLQKWNIKGKKKQILRTALNQAAKQGIVISENYDEDRHNQADNGSGNRR